jgi:hypothetical protein
MLKRHDIEILLKAGHPKTEVARLTGVSLGSVKGIAGEGPVVHVDDTADRQAKHRRGFPETGDRDSKEERRARPSFLGNSAASSPGGLSGRQDGAALVTYLRPKKTKPLIRGDGGELGAHSGRASGQLEWSSQNGSEFPEPTQGPVSR